MSKRKNLEGVRCKAGVEIIDRQIKCSGKHSVVCAAEEQQPLYPSETRRCSFQSGRHPCQMKEYFEGLLNPVTISRTDTPHVHYEEEAILSEVEVAQAIKSLKAGKAAGCDEIRPEMLKALGRGGILWLTRVCQVAWSLGKVPKDWQTGVMIPIHKKGSQRECKNYRGIYLLSIPVKVYAKCLERRCLEIVKHQLEDGQCGAAWPQHNGSDFHSPTNL